MMQLEHLWLRNLLRKPFWQNKKMFKEWFDAWLDEVYASKRYYTTIVELSKLSDRELSDLGISRSEIPFLAMKNCRY